MWHSHYRRTNFGIPHSLCFRLRRILWPVISRGRLTPQPPKWLRQFRPEGWRSGSNPHERIVGIADFVPLAAPQRWFEEALSLKGRRRAALAFGRGCIKKHVQSWQLER